MRPHAHNGTGADDAETNRQAGFTLIETMIAVAFVATSLVAFLGAMLSTEMLARSSREYTRANVAILRAVEEFRGACREGFAKALADFGSGSRLPPRPEGLGGEAAIATTVVLDETMIVPATDLNGDGDAVDVDVLPQQARGAAFHVRVWWGSASQPRQLEYTALVTRDDL